MQILFATQKLACPVKNCLHLRNYIPKDKQTIPNTDTCYRKILWGQSFLFQFPSGNGLNSRFLFMLKFDENSGSYQWELFNTK